MEELRPLHILSWHTCWNGGKLLPLDRLARLVGMLGMRADFESWSEEASDLRTSMELVHGAVAKLSSMET